MSIHDQDDRRPKRRLLRVETIDDDDPDRDAKCPGYLITTDDGIDRIARCADPHAHQTTSVRRVFCTCGAGRNGPHDPTCGETELVSVRDRYTGLPAAKPGECLGARRREREELEDWASGVGLEERPEETVEQHAARCLEFMRRSSGASTLAGAVLGQIRTGAEPASQHDQDDDLPF